MNTNTGYPHLDKPWMQYYKNKEGFTPDTNMTDYLKIIAKDWQDKIAEEYYGKTFTYNDLFSEAQKAAAVLTNVSVKKGDIVLCLVPNIPEASFLWLGASQIGAVCDFIDPRPDSMDINANSKKLLEIIKFEKPKFIVALDKCYLGMLKPIENDLKELGINTIITLNASSSMNIPGKIDYLKDVLAYNELKNIRNQDKDVAKLKNYQVLLAKLKAMREEDNIYKEAVKNSPLTIMDYAYLRNACANYSFTEIKDASLPNYIGHTSGTSGSRPKPILATNKNAISTLDQLIKGDVAFKLGEKALHVLPFFAPFGAYDNYLLNLVSGTRNIDIPEFEISEFGYLINKHRPNVIMANPAWLAALPTYKGLENTDLSCITKIIYGGEAMTAEDEENVTKWLKKNGSSAELEKGYGMSEFMGCGSYAQKAYNIHDSIGIPLPDTTFGLVDPSIDDRLVPVKFAPGEKRVAGELVVSSDAVTSGILHDNIIVPHYMMDGKSYIRTRDLVEMDQDGVFYHQARKDRSFSRFDGFKIKPHELEKIVSANPLVKYVKIVNYFDENRKGFMPICHIVLEEGMPDNDRILAIVKEIVSKEFINNPVVSSRQIPTRFVIREEIPVTKNGKDDFKALISEQDTKAQVCVDIEETNLTVENINIYLKNNLTRVLKK